MADPAARPAAARPAALTWALVAAGLALCALATWIAPSWIGSLEIESGLNALMLLYAAIFLPMLLVAFVFSAIERFPAFRIGLAPGGWALIGAATGISGLGIAVAYAALAGSLVTGNAGSATAGGLALGLVMILFQTGSEEIFFRGWLQTALLRPTGAVAAIAISALLFMGFHMLGGARSAMALVNLLLGGIWFGLLAWRSGGLVAPLLAHFGWNASEELITGLMPNPGTGSFGAMLDWDLGGTPLWGGGPEGLNTSIGMFVVLLALILPLAWRGPVIAPAVPVPHQPGRAAG